MNIGNTPSLKNPIKGLVSKNKRRFEWDGFNLDLTYITDNILAMGFPSENIEAFYRNSIDQVQRFLEERHKDHYKVYNLCTEKHYGEQKFNGRFVEYPFEDHNAPPFDLVYRCCADMKQWIQQDPSNIAAIHCKAGKGRTGVMICCYLLYNKLLPSAEQCLKYYSEIRTIDGKGVTIPSQIRYVKYFSQALSLGITTQSSYLHQIQHRKIKITSIKMSHCPQIHTLGGGCIPWVSIITDNKQFRSKYSHELKSYKTGEKIDIKFKMPFEVEKDFKITFFSKGKIIKKSQEIMRVWLNCLFVKGGVVRLGLGDMDGVKLKDKRFGKEFVVEVGYEEV